VKVTISKRRAPARQTRTPAITREQSPALADFLSGYLHQDFVAEHRTPARAYRAFLADASPLEIRNLQRESRAVLAATRAASWPAMREAFAALNSVWAPPSRAALERFLRTLAAGPKRPRA
jgi:hypothetical protein